MALCVPVGVLVGRCFPLSLWLGDVGTLAATPVRDLVDPWPKSQPLPWGEGETSYPTAEAVSWGGKVQLLTGYTEDQEVPGRKGKRGWSTKKP